MKSELDIANDLNQFINELLVRIDKARQAIGCLTGIYPEENHQTPPPPMKKPHPVIKSVTCKECGKEFEPMRKNQHYCCRKCCQKVSNRNLAEKKKKTIKAKSVEKPAPKPKHKPIEKQDSTEQTKISQAAIRRGSVKDKIPVQINDKTIIFVKEGHDIEKAKARYLNHINHIPEEETVEETV